MQLSWFALKIFLDFFFSFDYVCPSSNFVPILSFGTQKEKNIKQEKIVLQCGK